MCHTTLSTIPGEEHKLFFKSLNYMTLQKVSRHQLLGERFFLLPSMALQKFAGYLPALRCCGFDNSVPEFQPSTAQCPVFPRHKPS